MALAAARDACRRAIVGRGVARVGLASSGTVLKAPFTLFNGGTSGGVTRLFVQSVVGMAGPSLVAVGKVRRHGRGLEASWRVPRILEGDGSLLDFRLHIGRTFAASGWRHSYLSARCRDGELYANFPKLAFVNETGAPNVASRTFLSGGLLVPCGPKR